MVLCCTASSRGQQPDPAATEVAEVRANAAAFADAFNRGDAEALANFWTANGEYLDEAGNVHTGRDAIAAGYRQFFAEHPGAVMNVVVDRVLAISPTTAIEDGRATIDPHPAGDPGTGRYTAVHVKSDGKWLIASLRDLHEPIPTTYPQLADLEWMIGSWVAEENGGRLESHCRWAADKSFVLREYHATLPNGNRRSGLQVIGFNPLSGTVQSWTFDSDGGHAVGLWTASPGGWTIESQGILGDGTPTTAVNSLRRLDDQAYAWKSTQRSLAGQALPDSEEVVLRRQAAAK